MADRRSAVWRLADSVRVRTTLAAVAVVVVAIGLGALGLVAALRAALVDDIERSAERRAAEVAAALSGGEVPSRLLVSDDDEELVQVVAGDGAVMAASENVEGRGPVVSLDVDDAVTVDVVLDGETEALLVVAEDVEVEGRRVVVLVGRSLDEAVEPADKVRGLLWIAGPLLVFVVGATTWFVVGRALAPVGRIRREVEQISLSQIHRRVPMPAARDEIALLAETMNGMLSRLDEGQDRQRRFVADASHELRSPVAALRQHAEVALAHGDRIEVAELAGVVLAESLRMQYLVDDMLLLARTDEGSLHLSRRPVDLDDILFEEARRIRSGRTVRVDTSCVGAGRVHGDEAALRRVIRNLADNAARHASSRIAFSLASVDDVVILHVDDDGTGIPAEERQRVLERFVRLDEGRARDIGGAGLGLPIAHEVLAAHGGSITMSDSPTGGARATARLPALPD